MWVTQSFKYEEIINCIRFATSDVGYFLTKMRCSIPLTSG